MTRTLIRTMTALITIMLFSALGAFAGEEQKVNLDISKLPFKGPANAPVVMVVFSDYL